MASRVDEEGHPHRRGGRRRDLAIDRYEEERERLGAEFWDDLNGGEPVLVVDDTESTWDKLGRALLVYAGFGVRIEIRDPGNE